MDMKELIAWLTVLQECFPSKTEGEIVKLVDRAKRYMKKFKI